MCARPALPKAPDAIVEDALDALESDHHFECEELCDCWDCKYWPMTYEDIERFLPDLADPEDCLDEAMGRGA